MDHVAEKIELGTLKVRPVRSRLYPWYDSEWLEKYTMAKAIISKFRPVVLPTFEAALSVFRTRPDFHVERLAPVFDDDRLCNIRQFVSSLKPTDFELQEVRQFRRFVVHDHPFIVGLQQQLVSLMSEVVGEPVEPNYNFLSLYSGQGVCPMHMDAPRAKWTLDLCLDQSGPWPIYISEVQPWPGIDVDAPSPIWASDDWQTAIKQSQALNFSSYTMSPGDAIVFSGSSQWHYRNAMRASSANAFCDLLFFHFIPRGTLALVQPKSWASMFEVPELDANGLFDAAPTIQSLSL